MQKFLRGCFYWPSVLKDARHDVFEGFHLPLVAAPTGRTLLTIHDIRDMHGNWLDRTVYRQVIEQSFKSADHVITVSEHIRDEILGLFPNLRISVIYNGIDGESFGVVPEERLQEVRKRLALPDEFLLTVGHFEPRKNYAKLIEALAILHARGLPVHLVMVGNDSGELQRIREKIESSKLSGRVRIFNGLSDLEVRCLYKLCKLFVFPSMYEGFGIPILEAMAARRPMVLSDIAVFREITEGQGAYFSHGEPKSIAQSIEDVLSSSSECDRLIQYGARRVKDFSFKRIAADLAGLYKSLS
jgi:glycosyltransferase involved in cell wall biosynthesis